jgi:hypothetical protein
VLFPSHTLKRKAVLFSLGIVLDKYTLASGVVPVVLLLIALAFYLSGFTTIGGFPIIGAGEFVFAYLAAGQFTVGVFAAGTFAIGIFSAGIFAIGIFSIGIFSIGVFSFGIYALGIYVVYRFEQQRRQGR